MQFVSAQPLDLLYVSVVTFAEIRFGIELVKDAGRRMELNEWLDHKLRPMFEDRVLEITEDIMLKWRLLVEEGRKGGHTFSQPDLDHRGDRAAPRPHGRLSRYERLRNGEGAGAEPMDLTPPPPLSSFLFARLCKFPVSWWKRNDGRPYPCV